MATRRAQPYRKGSPLRSPGGALTAMLAGKPANLPHPSTPLRELQKSARKRKRRPTRRPQHRTPRP